MTFKPQNHLIGKLISDFNLIQIADYIRSCQKESGAILWFPGGKLDPWDHCEAAMALTISGDYPSAQKAYDWLHEHQRQDGSWYANYFIGKVDSVTDEQENKDALAQRIETHFVAYPATAIWHYVLSTHDLTFAQRHFPMVRAALNFVIKQQSAHGDVQWAINTDPKQKALPHDALITACSSILRSLEAGIHLAQFLGEDMPEWQQAYHKLAHTLRHKPHRFDRTWASKARFSMDWFYPILSGLFTLEEGKTRLRERWHEFVKQGLGCRCVNDEPWVTVAESCELVMALVAAKQKDKAHEVFSWLTQWRDSDGGFWTGYAYRDQQIWPREKTSWTAAAYLLAADALFDITPASGLFTHSRPFLLEKTTS